VPASADSEREYQNPAYVDVAPCPCDVTTSICDIGCCCDEVSYLPLFVTYTRALCYKSVWFITFLILRIEGLMTVHVMKYIFLTRGQ